MALANLRFFPPPQLQSAATICLPPLHNPPRPTTISVVIVADPSSPRCRSCNAYSRCPARWRTRRPNAWSSSKRPTSSSSQLRRPTGTVQMSLWLRFEGRTSSFGESWRKRTSWRGQTRTSETCGRTSELARPHAESAVLAVPQLTGCPGLLGQTLAALRRTLETSRCATSGPDGSLRCGREARPEVADSADSNPQVRPRRRSCCRVRRLMSRNWRTAGMTRTRRCRRGSTRRRSGSSGCRSSATRRCVSYNY